MPGKVLLSTAYLPPAEYIFRILNADEVVIEREENYIKQTYRNRCYILTASGLLSLTVPVNLGSFHKTSVKDIRIDYTKRWQHVHTRALKAAYASSPFFVFYYEEVERILLSAHEFLLDLNMELLQAIMKMMNIDRPVSYTNEFQTVNKLTEDSRYNISPKKCSSYKPKKYIPTFEYTAENMNQLSIVDLLLNTGPEAVRYL